MAADPPIPTFRSKPSTCLEVGPGPEDFAFWKQPDGTTRLFASVKTRRLWRRRSDDGKIVEVRLDREGHLIDGPRTVWPLFSAKPHCSDQIPLLQPVGVSLTESDGKARLFVIDSGGDEQYDAARILAFDVTEDGLVPAGEVIRQEVLDGGGEVLLPSANDLLALPDGHIYVSNPVSPLSPSAWTRYYRQRWPSLVHLGPPDSRGRRRAENVSSAADISFANGIAADLERDRMFVANYNGHQIVVFERDPESGALDRTCAIPVDGAPDNLMTDGGTLFVAAQRSRTRSFCHLSAPGLCGSPSRVFGIDLAAVDPSAPDCGAAARPRLLWDDDGAYVQAASTAYRLGDRLLVSQIVRDRIYVFDRRSDAGAESVSLSCTGARSVRW